MGPTNAIVEKGPADGWLYRVLRKGEVPWALRDPPSTEGLDEVELSALVLPAVTLGNQPQHTSPFLHATVSLSKAISIILERRHLYSNWLVRWPKVLPGIKLIDLTVDRTRHQWLGPKPGDTALLEECCRVARSFSDKDQEVIVCSRPSLRHIMWWNASGGRWEQTMDYYKGDVDAAVSQALQVALGRDKNKTDVG